MEFLFLLPELKRCTLLTQVINCTITWTFFLVYPRCPERLSWWPEREEVRYLTRPATSLASMTVSQKEETASLSPSLRTMAWTNVGRQRSSSSITSLRILQYVPPCPPGGLHSKQEPNKAPMSSKHLCQTVCEDTIVRLKPLLKEGTCCNDSEPSARLRQSLPPFRHEIETVLFLYRYICSWT